MNWLYLYTIAVTAALIGYAVTFALYVRCVERADEAVHEEPKGVDILA